MKTFKVGASEPFTHAGVTMHRVRVELPCGHGVVLVQKARLVTRPPPCPVCSGEESV